MRWHSLLCVVALAVANAGCGKIGDLILGKSEEAPAPVEAPVSSAPIPDSSVGPVQAPDMALPQGESGLQPASSTDVGKETTAIASGEQPIPAPTSPAAGSTVPPVRGWLGKVLDRKKATTPQDRETAGVPREVRPSEQAQAAPTAKTDALGALPRVETRAPGADVQRAPPLEVLGRSADEPVARVPVTPREAEGLTERGRAAGTGAREADATWPDRPTDVSEDTRSVATPRVPEIRQTPVMREGQTATSDRAAEVPRETRVVVPIPWLMDRLPQQASTLQRASPTSVEPVERGTARDDVTAVRDGATAGRTTGEPARAEPVAPTPRADTRAPAEVQRDTAERAAVAPFAAPVVREAARETVAPTEGARAVETTSDARVGTESNRPAAAPIEPVLRETASVTPRAESSPERVAAEIVTHDELVTHEALSGGQALPAIPRDEPVAAHADTEIMTHVEPVEAVHEPTETVHEPTEQAEIMTHDEPATHETLPGGQALPAIPRDEPVSTHVDAAIVEQGEPVAAGHEPTQTEHDPTGQPDALHDQSMESGTVPAQEPLVTAYANVPEVMPDEPPTIVPQEDAPDVPQDQTKEVPDTSSDVVITFDTAPVPQPEPLVSSEPALQFVPDLPPVVESAPPPEEPPPLAATEQKPPLPQAAEAELQCGAPTLFPPNVTPGLLPDPKHIKIPLMHPEMLAEKFVNTMFAVGVSNGFQFGLYPSYQYELQQEQQPQGPLFGGVGPQAQPPSNTGPGSPGVPALLPVLFNRNTYFKQMLQEDYAVTVVQLEQRQLRQLATLGFNVADVSCSTKLQHKDTALKYGMQLQCIDHTGGMYLDPGAHGKPIDVEAQKKAMQVWLNGYVKPNATQPGILAWRVYDEPNGLIANGIPGFLKDTLLPAFYAADPLHPVTSVIGGTNLASLLELYYGEVYELYSAASKGNEDYSESIAENQKTAAVAKYINATTLWTIDTGSYNVQAADIRKQAYLSLATGVNGIMCFSGQLQPPQWLRWPLEPGFGYNHMQGKQHGMFFDVESEELAEIAKLNDRLVPLGHLLVGATWLAAHPFQVESCPHTFLGSYSTAGVKYVQKDESSVQVGVWDTGTAFVLVVYNSNIKQAEVGTVRGPGFPASYHLYDLHTLQDLGAVLEDGYPVTLAPGDGQVFLVAEPAVWAAEKNVLHAKRYAFLMQRLNARLDELQHTPVDLAPVQALRQQAQAAFDSQQYAQAVPLLEQAEEKLQMQVAGHPVMGPITQSLQQARSLFGQINEWFRAKLPVIAQPLKPGPMLDDMQQLGNGHPGLQQIIDEQLRPVSKKYYPLVLGLEQSGAPTAKPADFAALVAELQATYAALQAWVPGGGAGDVKIPKLGVLTLSADDSNNPAWQYAQQNIPGAERLVLTGPGQFKKAGGVKNVNLDGFDLLWLHYVTPTGDDFLDTEQRVAAPAALLDAATQTALTAYAKTHGLLFSGYAPWLVHRWGLEPNAPNVLDQGTTGAFTTIYSGGQAANDQNLGVRVAPAFADHPMYQDLTKNAIWLRGEAVYRERHRFSWQYDPAQPETSFPKNGYILGGATYAILPPPDTHYDVVEYPQPEGGKILLVGLPFFDFDPTMNVGTWHADEYATLMHWMQNVLQYLGTPGTAVGKGQATGIQQPVYHVDFAKIEENPHISWQRNGQPVPPCVLNPNTPDSSNCLQHAFDKKLDKQWLRWWDQGKKGPMTLEIDLGQPAIINQVAIFNGWVSNGAGIIGKMTLQVKDESGVCVDPPGGPVTFYGNGTQGLTFYLPPVQTTGVCFVEMYSAEVEGNPKQPFSSIGANDVRIYGALPEAAVEDDDTHDATEAPHAPDGGAE